ncbi:MAG: hypothetical protein ABI607_08555 [Betaproteobacteria bacterium]
MSLLGKAALAMWWDMAPDVKAEFEDWHSHEHFPERLAVPGFRRGTRWTSAPDGQGIFVMYELASHDKLSSPSYVARLNAPTPWSTQLMPHHRNMVRSQCHVLESRGGGIGSHALTVRLSPASGRDADVRAYYKSLVESLVSRPGLIGAHLLRHQAPPVALTTEQKVRAATDQVADWVFVVCGYDLEALSDLKASIHGDAPLRLGVAQGHVSGLYSLAHSATAEDIA